MELQIWEHSCECLVCLLCIGVCTLMHMCSYMYTLCSLLFFLNNTVFKNYSCWLTTKDWTIFGFVAPMLAIILV